MFNICSVYDSRFILLNDDEKENECAENLSLLDSLHRATHTNNHKLLLLN